MPLVGSGRPLQLARSEIFRLHLLTLWAQARVKQHEGKDGQLKSSFQSALI